MADFVLPSKLVSEKIEVVFDFTDELEWGEFLTSWDFSVQTLTGDDASPELLLAQRVRFVGNTLKKQFYRGVPGCIYSLICDAVTSKGAKLRKTGKLAVLPDGAVNPPIYATFYTSRPYPIEGTDSFQVRQLQFVYGYLNYTTFLDSFQAGQVQPLSGDLWGSAYVYTPDPETFQVGLASVSGDLWGGLKSYSTLDSFQVFDLQILQGDLWGSVIAYTHPAEHSFSVSMSLLSGTLT